MEKSENQAFFTIESFLEKDAETVNKGIQTLTGGLHTVQKDLLENGKFQEEANQCEQLHNRLSLAQTWSKKLSGQQIRPLLFSVMYDMTEMLKSPLEKGAVFSQYILLESGKVNATFLQSAAREIGPYYNFGFSHTALFISIPSLLSQLWTVESIQYWIKTKGFQNTVKTNLISQIVKQNHFDRLIPVMVSDYSEEGAPCQLEDCKGILQSQFGFTQINHLTTPNIFFANVKTGETIVRKIPCQTGKPGKNIFGKELPHVPVCDVKLPYVVNGTLDQNELIITADLDGCLAETGKNIEVNPVTTVSDKQINQTQRYPNSVLTEHTLSGESAIETEGHCFLGANLEGCPVTAKGSILSNHGITGMQKTVLKSGGSVRCLYLHQTTVTAKEEVECHKEIIQCIIRAKRIRVTGKNGALFGGTLHAWNEVHADIIGSEAGIKTEIHLGEEVEEIESAIRKIQSEIKQKAKQKQQADATIQSLSKTLKKTGRLMPEQKREYSRTQTAVRDVLIELQKLDKSFAHWQNILNQSAQAGRKVIANQKLMAGTIIRIFDREYSVTNNLGPTIIHWFANEIVVQPYKPETGK